MRRVLRRRLVLLLALALVAATVSATGLLPPVQTSSVDLTAIKAAKKDVRAAVRCKSGELLQFWSDRVESIVDDTIKLKPGTYTIRIPDVPATTEVMERSGIARMSWGQGSTTPGDFGFGKVKLSSGPRKEAVSCEVVEVWAPLVDGEPFDKPVVLNQFTMSGATAGSATYENIKAKDVPKATACVVTMLPPPAWAEEVPADLRDVFTKAIMTPKKGTRVASKDAVPAGAVANAMRLMFFGTGSEERKSLVVNVLFTISDAAGRLLTRGHGFRSVGKKREQDVQDLAGYLGC